MSAFKIKFAAAAGAIGVSNRTSLHAATSEPFGGWAAGMTNIANAMRETASAMGETNKEVAKAVTQLANDQNVCPLRPELPKIPVGSLVSFHTARACISEYATAQKAIVDALEHTVATLSAELSLCTSGLNQLHHNIDKNSLS
jgi:hypothetical protein